MNAGFTQVLAATREERADLFVDAASRLRTDDRNVEKDFWVCWTLGALWSAQRKAEKKWPRLIFKGGTSLSKAFGLIERFSEDIDVAVSSEDLGFANAFYKVRAETDGSREVTIGRINEACKSFVRDVVVVALKNELAALLQSTSAAELKEACIEWDSEDSYGHTVLLRYPSVSKRAAGYIRPVVRVEFGALSAFGPRKVMPVVPYLAEGRAQLGFEPTEVLSIEAQRTFWDKIIILHGLRHKLADQGERLGSGDRVSRHYYDVHRLLANGLGRLSATQRKLAESCRDYSDVFYHDRRLALATAVPGTYQLVPTKTMLTRLRRDYRDMSTMIFGQPPKFDDIVASIARFEQNANDH